MIAFSCCFPSRQLLSIAVCVVARAAGCLCGKKPGTALWPSQPGSAKLETGGNRPLHTTHGWFHCRNQRRECRRCKEGDIAGNAAGGTHLEGDIKELWETLKQ